MSQETFEKIEKRRRVFVVALWLGMLGYVAFVPGSGAEGFYQCPFHVLTGFDCPGCGMTRASVHAIQGDLLTSIQYHPFGIVFVLSLTSLALFRLAELVKGRPIKLEILERLQPFTKKAWLGLLVLACVFGFGRLALEVAGILTPL